VAAIALTLLASGTLSVRESFAMIGGSRLGASFVVLAVGLLERPPEPSDEKRSAYRGRGPRRHRRGHVPAMALGLVGLEAGLFAGTPRRGPRPGLADLPRAYGPVLDLAARFLPRLVVFAAASWPLASFRLFDGALPDLQGRESPMTRAGRVAYRPWVMFVIGLLVSSLSSRSRSRCRCSSLAARGYVRRENVVPSSSAPTSPPSWTRCSQARWWGIRMPCAWWRS
jgi:hypothetical protein